MVLPDFKRGDTFRLPLLITERDGSGQSGPVNISGWSFRMEAREDSPQGRVVHRFDYVELNAVAGQGEFIAAGAATRSWPIKTLFLDIKVLDAAGETFTSKTMTLKVLEAVTR